MGIQGKLMLPLLIAFGTLMLVMHFYFEPLWVKHERALFEGTQHEILSALNPDIIRHVLAGDYAALYATLSEQSEIRQATWKQLTLHLADGSRIYPISDPEPFDVERPYSSRMDHSIELGGRELARIQLITDWSELRNQAVERVRELMRLLLLIFALVSVFAMLLQSILVRRPLVRLEHAASRLSHGDFSVELPPMQRDEVGRLTKSFVTMRENLLHTQEDLRKTAEEAHEANLAKSQFLSTMSHEIRTPMNGVLGMVQLLSMTDLNPEQKDYVDVVSQSGQSLMDIINDILDFSKLDSERMELEAIPFDLEVLGHEVMTQFAKGANDAGIELIHDYSPGCPRMIVGDPLRMRQVFVNLLGNALKFTKSGFIRLGVGCEAQDGETASLLIEVQDTGIGIAPDYQERLFDSFTQADQTTSRKYGGTGLGLAICKRLVELMGGEIWVKSEAGIGTVFKMGIRFPINAESGPAPGAGLEGVRILLVEPHAEHRRVLRGLLESRGVEVEAMDTLSLALPALVRSAASGRPFRIVVLDQQALGSDRGITCRIRQQEGLAGIHLLVLRYFGGRDGSRMLEESGFDAYLNKPVISRSLYEVIGRVLEQTPARVDAVRGQSVRKPGDSSGALGGGRRLLLVEDVPVNRKVASLMLEKAGFELEFAEDGEQAVAMWEPGKYALILMDCRMPNMDGYEATRLIRSREQGTRDPIIALTANAGVEDRDRCREAGMDDIITKPFRTDDLLATLHRWIARDGGADGGEANDRQENQEDSDMQAVDPGVLETFRRDMGEGFPEIMEAVHQNICDLIRQIEERLAGGETGEITRLAHSIKSPAASIGAMELSRLARVMETDADSGDLSHIDDQLAALKREYRRVESCLEEMNR